MKRDIEIAGLPWQTLEFERRGEGEFERAITTMLCVCVLSRGELEVVVNLFANK